MPSIRNGRAPPSRATDSHFCGQVTRAWPLSIWSDDITKGEHTMTQSLLQVVADAIEELRDWHQDNPDEREPHDQIHQIADSSVPVYTYDLLRLAADNCHLAVDEPELGPAFDGAPTPVNIIAANVFEHIEQALWEAWSEMEDEEDTGDE